MPKATQIGVWCAILSIVLAVQSCREDEHDRPLTYDKGSYQGQPDEALTEGQVDTLRERAAGQKF